LYPNAFRHLEIELNSTIEIFHFQPKTPTIQRRATFSNLPSFIADHFCNQNHQTADSTKSKPKSVQPTSISKPEDSAISDKKSIVFEADL
jgi:hypothetical protein